jgi:hypothetical protein
MDEESTGECLFVRELPAHKGGIPWRNGFSAGNYQFVGQKLHARCCEELAYMSFVDLYPLRAVPVPVVCHHGGSPVRIVQVVAGPLRVPVPDRLAFPEPQGNVIMTLRP